MCILGKLLGAETYWFENLRAERGELFNVFMYGSVKGISGNGLEVKWEKFLLELGKDPKVES